jgi:hypothetical protein
MGKPAREALIDAAAAGRERAVYTVGDASHFLGVVALVNSLRLSGWNDEIVLVDCGLTEGQRSFVEREVRLLGAPASFAPHFLKVVGPVTRPARTMAVIDADVVVTRSLDPLFAEVAKCGKLIAVTDALGERFDERWDVLLDLGPLRRQPYVNSGFLVAPLELGLRIFRDLGSLQERVDVRRSMIGSGKPEDPFYFLDQDALNALLLSGRFEAADVHALPYAALPHPPFAGIRVADKARMRISAEGAIEPFGLHHIQQKPWLQVVPRTPYSQLLPRLWLADDLALRLEASQVPLRFRPGGRGVLAARWAGGRVRARRARRALGIRRSRRRPSTVAGSEGSSCAVAADDAAVSVL